MKRLAGILGVLAFLVVGLILANCSDESTQPCCRVCVNVPNGGEHWQPGESYTLRWCADGPCGSGVRIELLQHGEVCRIIATEAPNEGSLVWEAEGCSDDSTGYRIRISGGDEEGSDESDEDFFIAVPEVPPPPPTCELVLVSPVGGERYPVGTTVEIEWQGSAACCDSVRIELLHEGAPCAVLLEDGPADGSLQWSATPCAEDTAGYTIRATELCSGTHDASDPFTIYTPIEPPEECALALSGPNGGEEYFIGDTVPVSWTWTGDCLGDIRVELLRDGALCAELLAAGPLDQAFSWTAAQCDGESEGYRVRITDITSGAVDVSDAPFRILAPCAITILSPNGGEQWVEGLPGTITWETTGHCGNEVDLRLFLDNEPCATLSVRVPDTGSYTWTAAEQCDNTSFPYRLEAAVVGSTASDRSDNDFYILDATVAPECQLTYLGPNDTASFCPGDPVEIRWGHNGECSPTVRIELLHQDEVCATIAETTANDGALTWTAAACAGETGDYLIRISDPAEQRSAQGTQPFAILPACAIALDGPLGGSFCAGSPVAITWASGSCCGANVRIDLLQNGDACATLAASTPNDGAFEWSALPCDGATENYAIRVTDLESGASDVTGASFSVHPACAITVSEPLDGDAFCSGAEIDVRWTASTCCGPTVRIELLRGGSLYQTLAEAEPNDGHFIWPAALLGPQTNGFSVRVTDTTSGASDRSDGTFDIFAACALTVLSPFQSREFCEGDPITIAWNHSSCCGPEVEIELLRDGEVVELLAQSTPNDGEFVWNAQRIGGETEGYAVRVSDLSTGAGDEGPALFRILPGCSLTMLGPEQEAFCEGEEVEIAWQTSSCCEGPSVKIELLHEGEVCGTIAASTPNDGRHAWTAAPCAGPGGDYAIRVTQITSGASDESAVAFAILPPCGLAMTAPSGGTYCEGQEVAIGWTRGDCCGEEVRIELLDGDEVCATIAAATENDGAFTWPAAPCGGESGNFFIRLTDPESGASATTPIALTLHPACANSVLYPAQGDLLCRGDDATINWEPGPCCGANVKIQLYHDDTLVSTIVASTPNDGEHFWANAQPYQSFLNGYAIVITDLTSGRTTRGAGEFSIWSGQISLVSPLGGASYCEQTPVLIAWASSPCAGPSVKIELLRGGVVCRTIAAATPNDGSHLWDAERCGAFTDDYKIRVTDTSSGRSDESDVVFEILEPCTVEVSAPASGAAFCPGDPVGILWDAGSDCCGDEVKIELLRDGGVCEVIAAATENDGAFDWTAEPCGTSGDYRIRVTDLTSLRADENPGGFTIHPPCDLGVTAPVGGESYCVGDELDILWTTSVCCGPVVDIVLYQGGVPVTTIADDTPNDGSYVWPVEQWLDVTSGYAIRVSDPQSGLWSESAGTFQVYPACTLDVLYPDGGELLCQGDTVDLTWEAGPCCGDAVRIELLNRGVLCETIAIETPNDGSYTWTVMPCDPLLGNISPRAYRIRIVDLGGETINQSEANFTIGGECTLLATLPTGGQMFCRESDMTIRWSASECCGASVKIELLRMGRVFDVIAEATENDGVFVYPIPPCDEGSPWSPDDPCPPAEGYQIRITDLSNGLVDETNGTFEIHGPCTLDVYEPMEGATFCVGEPIEINWLHGYCCGKRVSIELLHEGTPCLTIVPETLNDGNYTWSAEQCGGQSTGYALRMTDLATGEVDLSHGTFTIEACAAAPGGEADDQ